MGELRAFFRRKSKTVFSSKKSLKFAHQRAPEKEASLWRLGLLSVDLNPPKPSSRVAIWANFAVVVQGIYPTWRSSFGGNLRAPRFHLALNFCRFWIPLPGPLCPSPLAVLTSNLWRSPLKFEGLRNCPERAGRVGERARFASNGPRMVLMQSISTCRLPPRSAFEPSPRAAATDT